MVFKKSIPKCLRKMATGWGPTFRGNGMAREKCMI